MMGNEKIVFEPNTTQTPNYVLDVLMGHYSGEVFKVLCAIIRKTYGWQKRKDKISISQIHALTKLSKPTIIKSLKILIRDGHISRGDFSGGLTYQYNIHINENMPLPVNGVYQSIQDTSKPDLPDQSTAFTTTGKSGLPLPVNGVYTQKIIKDNNKNTNRKIEPSLKSFDSVNKTSELLSSLFPPHQKVTLFVREQIHQISGGDQDLIRAKYNAYKKHKFWGKIIPDDNKFLKAWNDLDITEKKYNYEEDVI